MQNILNRFATTYIDALNKNTYPAFLNGEYNYEEYFKNATSFKYVYDIFKNQIKINDDSILALSFDDILGFYLLYHIFDINNKEDVDIVNIHLIKNNTTDFNNYLTYCRDRVTMMKNNAFKIATKINMINSTLENIQPVEFKETDYSMLQFFVFSNKDGTPTTPYDACKIFNSIKTSVRFPLIIYVNSIGKNIIRVNSHHSISFNPEVVLKNDFPINSLILCTEVGELIVFDFNTNKFSMKMKSDTNDDRLKRISSFLSMLDFKKDSGYFRISGSVTFYISRIIDTVSLYTFFITNPIARTLFFINETAKPWCLKNRFYIFFRDFCPEMIDRSATHGSNNYLRISVTEKTDNKNPGFTVNFITKNKDLIPSFIYKTSRLLSIISGDVDSSNIAKKFNNVVYIKPLFKLNEHASELFKIEKKSRGESESIPDGNRYCRKCSAKMQPIIVENDELNHWIAYGREPILYPDSNSVKQYWFVCPLDEYPNVNMIPNLQDTTGKIKYLPCCKKQKKDVVNTTEILKVNSRANTTDAPNDFMGFGMLNDAFNIFLSTSFTTDVSTTINFLKMGTSFLNNDISIFNSFIVAVIFATGKSIDESNPITSYTFNDIMKQVLIVRKKMAELPTDIYRQELYDMSDKQIIESILNPKTFIDPYLYYRGLEILFGVQIFVFSSDKGRKTPFSNKEKMLSIPTLEVPRCKHMHIRSRNDNPIICIYKNYGNSLQNLMTIPTCELVVYSHSSDPKNYNKIINNNNIGFFDSMFGMLKKSCHPYEWYDNDHPIEQTCLDDPYSTIEWDKYEFVGLGSILGQEIDIYGKTIGLIFKDWKLIIPPTQPLYLPSTKSRIIRINYQDETEIDFITMDLGQKRLPDLKSKSEAKQKFNWSEEDEDGIWIAFNGISKGIKVICLSDKAPGKYAFDSCTKIIDRKNKTSILLQLINWLWRSDWDGNSFPVFSEWWHNNSEINDKDIFNNVPDTFINCNNLMLPELNSFKERIAYLSTIWPFFFHRGKIHVSKNLYRMIENCFNIEDIYSRGLTPNDVYGEINRFIVGLLPTDTDYKRNDDLILINKQHIKDWINRNNSSIYKYKSLHNADIIETLILPQYKAKYEPFLFQNKNGKIYIIQNAMKESTMLESCALQIAQFWKDHKRNPGCFYTNNDKSYNITNVKYIAYTNENDGISVYKNNTSGETDYLEIFKYDDDQTFAAMLPIL